MAAPLGKCGFRKLFTFYTLRRFLLGRSYTNLSTFYATTSTQQTNVPLSTFVGVRRSKGPTNARQRCQHGHVRLLSNPARVVLGIETSCDDTGAAVVNERGEVLGEALHSQTELTVQYVHTSNLARLQTKHDIHNKSSRLFQSEI